MVNERLIEEIKNKIKQIIGHLFFTIKIYKKICVFRR